MTITIFKNCLVLENGKEQLKDLYVNNEVFCPPHSNPDHEFDLAYSQVIPGLIDIHTHGAVGIDFNRIQPEELQKIIDFYTSNGVTSLLATILSDHEKKTIEQLHIVSKAMREFPQIKGIHLEGPFLNKIFKGAMPEECLQLPNLSLFNRFQEAAGGTVRLITVAPELEGAKDFIREVTQTGVIVSMGHSNATYQETQEAIASGATGTTHTFNAMRLFHQHEPAIMGAVLMDDSVFCEAICDFVHLNQDSFKFLIKVKGVEKTILVTDSIMAAGLGDGDYYLGINEVSVRNGDAVIKGTQTRAGSVLTGFKAVLNAAQSCSLSTLESARLMTQNPSVFLRMPEIGNLNIGSNADFLVIRENEIKNVYCAGKRVK